MILVDTNVVSEAMKASPTVAVFDWLNAQDSAQLYVSAVTIGEIEYGLRILPDGKRRRDLRECFNRYIARAFPSRILTYDEAAARVYGRLMGARRAIGRPMSLPDGQIAAIAAAHRFAIATRNVKDFEECGIELINPFTFTPTS